MPSLFSQDQMQRVYTVCQGGALALLTLRGGISRWEHHGVLSEQQLGTGLEGWPRPTHLDNMVITSLGRQG